MAGVAIGIGPSEGEGGGVDAWLRGRGRGGWSRGPVDTPSERTTTPELGTGVSIRRGAAVVASGSSFVARADEWSLFIGSPLAREVVDEMRSARQEHG